MVLAVYVGVSETIEFAETASGSGLTAIAPQEHLSSWDLDSFSNLPAPCVLGGVGARGCE